jgi:DnaJ family protein C protein 9
MVQSSKIRIRFHLEIQFDSYIRAKFSFLTQKKEKMETHIRSQLLEAFGSTDLYAILGVQKGASSEEINKAYKKFALKYHPDRKDGDPVKFKGLSCAHSILSDPAKKETYDRTGDCDIDDVSEEEAFWTNYFRALYPALTVEAIRSFQEKYIGSEEERQDIIDTYNDYHGDLAKMMECIMCAEEGDEARICAVIDAAIENKELKSTTKYKNAKAHIGKGKKLKGSKSHSVHDNDGEDDRDPMNLALQIAMNRKNQSSRMASIFSKYADSDGGFGDEDISDDAFAATQKRVLGNKSNSSQKGSEKKKAKNK